MNERWSDHDDGRWGALTWVMDGRGYDHGLEVPYIEQDSKWDGRKKIANKDDYTDLEDEEEMNGEKVAGCCLGGAWMNVHLQGFNIHRSTGALLPDKKKKNHGRQKKKIKE